MDEREEIMVERRIKTAETMVGLAGAFATIVALYAGMHLGAFLQQRDLEMGVQVSEKIFAKEKIDRDELPDLFTLEGIFLADETAEGVVYRPLASLDIYRIK